MLDSRVKMALRHFAIVVLFLLTTAVAKNCIGKKGTKKCTPETSSKDCDPGTICLNLSSGQSGETKGVCGPPQGYCCDCDPTLLTAETCVAGYTCQSTKCSSNGCKYECKEPSEDEQQLQCRDEDSNQWKLVYQTDQLGTNVTGTIDDLKELVNGGAELKVKSHLGLHSVQKVSIGTFECAVYAQILFYMPFYVPGGNAFSMFMVASTKGNMHITSLFPGIPESDETTALPYMNSNFQKALTWFARNSSSKVPNPKTLAKTGATVRVLSNNTLRQIEHVSVSESLSGQIIWEMKDILQGREFYASEHWQFSKVDSSGTLDGTGMIVHTTAVNGTISEDFSDADYYADTCWQFVYRHDASGNAVSGSLSALVGDVRDGRKVMIRVDSVSHEVSKIVIPANNSSVSAQVYDSLDNDLAVPTWAWLIATTDGSVIEIRKPVGNSASPEVTPSTREITWFTERRSWTLAYHHDNSGAVLAGSAGDLTAAYNGGADFRYGISRDGRLEILQADYVRQLGPSILAYFDRELDLDGNDVYRMYSFTRSTGEIRRKRYVAEGLFQNDEPADPSGPFEHAEIKWWTSGFQ